ncbi:hypothetical protein AMIS_29820 [Actinoplanes missouriensis 431]|uniref:Uncharacterized protein n=1 Tax=Actinoplanes missouriensis (strain ATCC 14538 / DSM 43046 / CBS 188.64 / JCM 3121 / NBRC 102363 / NCIMB 12654 / NRRL B-3342 / UNCC 431) TaxID=512565 RepID=I0H5B5_ACTM4|nr:hypothetical protein [Actinoplanes missouriensis]BAL88202.1 hypothetical protein AMIS_29820 [Actinoplanes missouriensis 431]
MSSVLVLAGVVFILCGLGFMIVQLRRGDIGIGVLRGESEETRRAVRRAIRDGYADDARVDHLARRALEAAVRPRWARYFFAAMLLLSIVLLAVGSHTVTDIAVRIGHVLLWSGLIALTVVNRRRLDDYRGLRPARPDTSATTASRDSDAI